MIKHLSKVCSALVSLIILSGCASTNVQKTTGFLDNAWQLVDSKQYKHTKIYNAPHFKRADYAKLKKIHLTPFELWMNPAGNKTFNPRQLAELSSYFTATLAQKLSAKNYQLVTAPSADALTIRGAFSDIAFITPQLSPTDFIPFRIVLNAGNAAYLHISDKKEIISSVSIEVEFLQGLEQKRVFAMLASKQLDQTIANNGADNLTAVMKVLDNWIDNFVAKITTIRDAA